MTIAIDIKTPMLPADMEKLEDGLRDFLNSKGIEGVIEGAHTGNITVARGFPVLTEERLKGLLEEWNAEQKKASKIDVFERAHSYRDSIDLKALEKAVKDGNTDDLAMRLAEACSDYHYDLFREALTDFLDEKDLDLSDYGTAEFEEFRDAFEARFVWNIGAIADYNVLLFEKKMYEIEFDGVTSSPDNVEQTDEFLEFKKRALTFLTEAEFNEILTNCFYSGHGYFGIIANAGDILEALQSDDRHGVTGMAVVGIHDRAVGAGYKVHSRKRLVVDVRNAILDSGTYGIGATFGTTEWVWN